MTDEFTDPVSDATEESLSYRYPEEEGATEPGDQENSSEHEETSLPGAVAPPQLRNESNLKSPVMNFAVGYLRSAPEASFKQVQQAASRKGFEIYPITYGRAKALLGLVVTRPRRRSRPEARTPSRSLVQGAPPPSPVLRHLAEQADRVARERDRYRATLLDLRDLLRSALGRG